MKVRNAGAIFIGEYSSEPLGLFCRLPTMCFPQTELPSFFLILSVDDFIKKSSIVYYSRSAEKDP